MASITDERGYNQGFVETKALRVRTDRRKDAMISEMKGLNAGSTILELGCGTGMLSYLMAKETPAKVTGIDLSEKFIGEARRAYQHERLSFENKSLGGEIAISDQYDYIVGNGIIHHVYFKIDQVLEDMSKSLNPGGKLIFWEPNLWNPYVYLIFTNKFLRRVAKLEEDEMAFSKTFIEAKLRQHGFRNINVQCRDFLLPNTPDFLIGPTIRLGSLLEKSILSRVSQSLFIVAEKR